jgi:hypothetical protein
MNDNVNASVPARSLSCSCCVILHDLFLPTHKHNYTSYASLLSVSAVVVIWDWFVLISNSYLCSVGQLHMEPFSTHVSKNKKKYSRFYVMHFRFYVMHFLYVSTKVRTKQMYILVCISKTKVWTIMILYTQHANIYTICLNIYIWRANLYPWLICNEKNPVLTFV